MGCLNDEEVAALVGERALSSISPEVDAHLDGCSTCRELVARLLERDASVHAATRYELGREIARGGMGRICEARDLRLSRSVALKLPLRATPALRRRFEREMRITARLQHPAIVPVYEAGELDDGSPFYAMRLVAGRPFDRVVAARPALSERLALVPALVAACDAMAYAHDQGIVHRDLKPANVLIGEHGETVIIDWGLAKDLRSHEEQLPDETSNDEIVGHTAAGTIVGTLAYMPPEQARGVEVAERADVYALGSLIYHAIASVPPYESERGDELARRLEAGPPPSLAMRCPDAPRDLCAIVDRAMAREPSARYANASELAADLKRYQNGALVSAQRYSAWQLVRRFVARHRPAVAVGLAGLLLLIALGVAAVHKLSAQRDRAETLVSFMLGDLYQRLDAVGRLDALEGVADQVQRYYDEAGQDRSTDERRAQAQETLGDVRQAQGRLDEAQQIYQTLLTFQPTSVHGRLLLAGAFARIAGVELDRGRLAEAQAHAQRAVTLDEEITHTAASPETDAALAQSLVVLGDARRLLGASEDALGAYDRARALVESRAATETPRAKVAIEALSGISKIRSTQGQYGRGVDALEEAMALIRAALVRSPGDTQLLRRQAVTDNMLGRLAMRQRQVDAAVAHYRASVAICRGLVGREPANLTWQSDLALALKGLESTQLELGRLDEATAIAEERHALVIELARRSPDDLSLKRDAVACNTELADIAERKGDHARVLALLREEIAPMRALAAREPSSPDRQQDLATSLANVSEAEMATDRGLAARDAAESLALRRRLVETQPNDARFIGDLIHALLLSAQVQAALGHQQLAEEALSEAHSQLAADKIAPQQRRVLATMEKEIVAKVTALH